MEKKTAVKKSVAQEAQQVNSPLPKEDPKQQLSMRMRHLFGEEALRVSKLPVMSADKPFLIATEKQEIAVLNDLLIGSITAEDEGEDIVRNALRLAKIKGCSAVLVTADVIYAMTQKYGNQRPYHTQVSGIKIDSKKVQAGYPKGVVEDKDFESVEKRLEKGHAVFMTLQMRLEHNLDMLEKVFKDKNGKPLFNGPVYVTFGKREDELVMFYANELTRIEVYRTKAWATKRIRELTNERRKKGTTPEAVAAIDVKIHDFREFLNIFVIMGNNADQSIDTWRNMVTGYLIRKYEERIPNSKVISVGDAFLRVDTHLIMATTIKGKAAHKLATQLAKKTEGYSKGHETKNIPEVLLGKGPNPYLDMKFVTYQATDEKGDKRMLAVVQLPMCRDSELYRDVIRNQNVTRDTITKVVDIGGFESGVLTLKWSDGLSLPIFSFWSSELLKNQEIFKDDASIRSMVDGKKKEYRLIFGHKEGCSHYGANDVVLYDSPNDPHGQLKKYHHQVAKEFLLACDAPILHHQHDGDITQQMNHSYEKNVHKDYLLPEELRKKMELLEKSDLPMTEKFKALKTLSLEQKIRCGVSDWDEQIDGYAMSLELYLEYFVRILCRSKKANLSFEDMFSVITHISGNHNKNTFKNLPFHVSDAKHIMTSLREMLLYYLIDKHRVELASLVKVGVTSPRFGPLGEGRGALCIDGRRCYSMVLKHKQGAMDKTQDRGYRRGIEYYEVGLPICNLSGDDHKGGVRVNRGIVHIKTGCQQGEGPFGHEIDFSEQNVFSMVYGMPVGGLSSGPLVFIVLDYQTMRRYAAKPFTVHRNELFKNALE